MSYPRGYWVYCVGVNLVGPLAAYLRGDEAIEGICTGLLCLWMDQYLQIKII